MALRLFVMTTLGSVLLGTGCASSPTVPMTRARYASLKNEKFLPNDVAAVWKAVEGVTANYKIAWMEAPDPNARALETDWIYTRSRDKHDSVRIAGEVKNFPLESRIRFKIMAHGVLGGTEIRVETSEEIEKLGLNGRSKGYEAVARSEEDTSRASDLLDKISLALISPHP